MPRAKSPSTGKISRATTKDQAAATNPMIPNDNPMAVTAAASAPAPAKEVQPETPEVKTTTPEVKAAAAPAPETKKFELHKSEQRHKVVPINVEDEIRRRAYELSQQRGQGAGSPAEDWLAAEREVMQRYRQQRA
jgi:hypothetical protein